MRLVLDKRKRMRRTDVDKIGEEEEIEDRKEGKDVLFLTQQESG